jgi:alpha-1,3-rhamnosyl/mannosyltransferase
MKYAHGRVNIGQERVSYKRAQSRQGKRRMKRLLVNAVPLTVVGTGIARYLGGLYGALEQEAAGEFEVWYFDGSTVSRTMPAPGVPGMRERIGRILWRMPWPVAYGARLLDHARMEAAFTRAAQNFDCYHEAGYFPLNTGQSMRTVLTIYDMSLMRHPEWHPRERVEYWKRRFFDRLDRVDHILAISRFTRDEIVDLLDFPEERITVTPLGVDHNTFNMNDDAEADHELNKLGVPEDFVLFVGSGDPRKNLDVARSAVGRVQHQMPLVAVGWSGWEPGTGGVLGLGYVSDRLLAQLYRRASVFVMPSSYEGFGLPVVEAMACGCPSLVADAGSLPEVGGDGVHVFGEAQNVGALAESIEQTMGSKAFMDALRKKGVQRAKSFDWPSCARLSLQRFR